MLARMVFLAAFLMTFSSGCRQESVTRTETSSSLSEPAAVVSSGEVTSTFESNVPIEPAASPAGEATPCTPAGKRLCPVDEGSTDPSFARFRQQMLAAVMARDATTLSRFVNPEIRTSFGDAGGIAEFRRMWKPESKESELWVELQAILSAGGTFLGAGEERSFWAPYVYSAWPDPYDAFMHVAAIRDGVPVRSRAEASAPTKATVDWEILEIVDARESTPGWHRVRTAAGVEGWVEARDVRSPIGYRAGFSQRSGQWRMDALVAGD